MVSLVKLIKSYFLMVYLMVYLLMVLLCGYLLMVHLWGYFNYFLLMYGIYISKTYFKKFSYNKDIKINIL